MPLESGPGGRCVVPRAIARGDTIKTLTFYWAPPVEREALMRLPPGISPNAREVAHGRARERCSRREKHCT